MMHILGIDHVVLRVHDMPRMQRFYTEVLGCEVERTLKEIGLVQMRAGQSLIDLIPADKGIGDIHMAKPDAAPGVEAANEALSASSEREARGIAGHNMDHFCLRVEPFDHSALISHLIKHGVVPSETRTRYGADGYGPSLYINDPEGNVVELKGPPS
jgi:catechol 2,3-dioxygenase-like lactoylglutathione lyase family enzyme